MRVTNDEIFVVGGIITIWCYAGYKLLRIYTMSNTPVNCKRCGIHGSGFNPIDRRGFCSVCSNTFYNFKKPPASVNMTDTVSIIWDAHLGAYKCNFPYSKGFVDFIKQTVPAAERSYDPPNKTWFFAEKYFPAIKIAAEQLYFQYASFQIFTKKEHDDAAKQWQGQSNWSTPVNTDTEANKFKKLLEDAGVLQQGVNITELTRNSALKLYRRAAMFYHPDRNPANADKMSELNMLWANLKEVYFKDEATV